MSKKSQVEKPKPEPKLKYSVVAQFWDGPHLKQVDDTVFKTKAEAQYMVPHILVLDEPEVKPAAEKEQPKDPKRPLPKPKR